MIRNKLFKLGVSIFTVCSLLLSFYINPVVAGDVKTIEPRAVERYTKSVNVACHDPSWGYFTVTATTSHNMTTGRFTLDSAKATSHFNLSWPGVTYKSFSTSPAVGSIINGSSIKVTVYYTNIFDLSSTTYSASDYIYL